MKISKRQTELAVILDIEGRIDLQTTPMFRKALLDSLQTAPSVIVNLLEVDYVDSSGIATMAEGHQHAKRVQKRILYFGVGSMVKNVLNLTHLSRIFEIFETEEQAMKAILPAG